MATAKTPPKFLYNQNGVRISRVENKDSGADFLIEQFDGDSPVSSLRVPASISSHALVAVLRLRGVVDRPPDEKHVSSRALVLYVGTEPACKEYLAKGEKAKVDKNPPPESKTHAVVQLEDKSVRIVQCDPHFEIMPGRWLKVRTKVVPKSKEKKRGRRNDLRQGRGSSRK